MKQDIVSSFESINKTLNYLGTLNFLLVENQNKILNNFSTSSSKGLYKSESYNNILDDRLNGLLAQREQIIHSLNILLYTLDWPASIEKNRQFFIDNFNKTLGINLTIDDCFTNQYDKYKLSPEIKKTINKEEFKENDKNEILNSFCNNYEVFYILYKKWEAFNDIYEVMINDVNEYGSKSLTYGIPKSENVKVLSTKKLDELYQKFQSYAKNTTKKLKKQYKLGDEVDEQFSNKLLYIDDLFCYLIERSTATTKNQLTFIDKCKCCFEDLIYSGKKNNFSLDTFYIHKNEINSLYTQLSSIDELKELAEEFYNACYGKNVNNLEK